MGVANKRVQGLALTLVTVMVVGAAASGAAVSARSQTTSTIIVDDDGGQGVDYTSIQAAVDNATPGQTVRVRPGIYNESVVIDKPITIIGDPGGSDVGPGASAPVMDSNFTKLRAFSLAGGISDVNISGVEIREYARAGIRGGPQAIAEVTIQDSYIHNISGARWSSGIASRFPQGESHSAWRIVDNRFAKIGFVAVHLGNAKNSVVSNNVVRGGIERSGLSNYSDAAIVVQSRSTEADVDVRNVTVENNTATGPFGHFGVYAITWVEPNGTNARLSGLAIHDNSISGVTNLTTHLVPHSGTAITTWTVTDRTNISNVSVRNNTVINATHGVKVGAIGGGTVHDARVTRNLVRDIDAVGISIGSNADSTFVNGTVHRNTVSDVGKQGILVQTFGNSTFRIGDVTENDVRNTSRDGVLLLSGWYGSILNTTISNNSLENNWGGMATSVLDNGSISGVSVSSNEIANSSRSGVFLLVAENDGTLSNVEFSRNSIFDNTESGIVLATPNVSAPAIQVTQNVISGNTEYGIRNHGTGVLNATRNWWGAASGPSSQNATNPVTDPVTGAVANGTGDIVSSGVHFDPWLTTDPTGPPAIGTDPPTDPDDDGVYEDVNGDGSFDILDVQVLFANRDDDAVANYESFYNFNGANGFNILDIQALFAEVIA